MGDDRLRWFCFFLLAVFHIEGSTAQCAQFTFPDLDSDVVTAAENTTISLKFAVRELTPGCFSNSGSFRVDVRKGDTFILCSMRYYDGQFSPQGPCTATSERGVFQFTYTVNRKDDKQQLRWRTSIASVASDKYITFNITYPSVMTTFALGGDKYSNVREVPQGQQLGVSCAWNHGNPRSAGIIYRYRNNENKRELSRTADSVTFLTHTISSAQCDDSGIYSCEVGDVSVNKTLLVKCPPTNLTPLKPYRFEEGGSVELWFTVHSYTPRMTSCRLEAVNTSMPSSPRKEDCQSSLTVTGSPPDLTVSVRLDSVRREDEGTWKLTLTNDVGTGETEFDLEVIELTTTTITTTTQTTLPSSTASLNEETETQNCVPMAIIIIVVENVAVIVVAVVVNIVCVRKGKCQRRRQQQPHAEMLDVIPSPGHRDPELSAAHAPSNQNESPYDGILEDRLPNDAGVYSEPYSDVPRNRTGPDGYLKPRPKQKPRDHNRPITSPANQTARDQNQPITNPAIQNPRDFISPIASPSDSRGHVINKAAGECSDSATYTPLLLSEAAEPSVYTALKKKNSPAHARMEK